MKFTKSYQPDSNRRTRGKGKKTIIAENRKKYEELFKDELSAVAVKREILLELMSIENKSHREYELIEKIATSLLPYQEIMMTREIKLSSNIQENIHQSTNDVMELYREIQEDE